MRNVGRLTLLAAVLSFIPLQEARAVSSNSGIWYFEATNEEVAVAETIPDYNEYAYYDIVVDVWIGAESVGGAGGQGGCTPFMSGCGYGHAEAVLPHHPDAEYELWSTHTVTPYVSDHTGSIWYDYYGYSYNYKDPNDPLIYPFSYYFAQGGTQQTSFTTILLGYLIAVSTGGTMHGPPHHVKVVDDDYVQTSDNNCGSKQRHLKLRPVDSSGRYAGPIRVRETLETTDGVGLQSVHDSCNGQIFRPRGCASIDTIPRSFTDQLWVGCPSIGGDCGFQAPNGPLIVSRWWWCPQSTSAGSVLLTSNVYYVTHNHVAINGRESTFPPGTHLH